MNGLITKIESYDFKDPLGHPLKNCPEWIELKNKIAEMNAYHHWMVSLRRASFKENKSGNVQGQS